MEVLLSSFHLNGGTLMFYLQTQNIEGQLFEQRLETGVKWGLTL